MLLFKSPSSNPFFNLALEEYLFDQVQSDFILIYINQDSVVCGKHQNPVAESNYEFLTKNTIPLIRRFSGGGTVYHDTGNVNFSFIHTGEDTKVIDFKRYASKIVEFLNDLGAPAELTERNDIFVDDKKVSGNAAHAKNKRALHHGTLLFNSELEKLSLGLKSNADKFKSRAVKSKRSPVANLKNFLNPDFSIDTFIELLMEFLSREFDVKEAFSLNKEQVSIIDELAESKYKSFEWNYGYGPAYTFDVAFNHEETPVQLEIEVEDGIINKVKSLHDSNTKDWSGFIGLKHNWKTISDKLAELIGVKSANEMIKHFF